MKEKNIGYLAPQYYRNVQNVSELGEEFQRVFEKMGEKARTSNPQWIEKNASMYFMFNDKPYRVEPSDLGCSSSEFARISRELEDVLYQMGAYEMFYSGMLD